MNKYIHTPLLICILNEARIAQESKYTYNRDENVSVVHAPYSIPICLSIVRELLLPHACMHRIVGELIFCQNHTIAYSIEYI